ncbi:MAG: hypothetical protein MMC33_010020 [Icmadophila ericetorum]|nr:hypothetical protein [Icmadophila ericetorum]
MQHDNPVTGLCSECSPPYPIYRPNYDVSEYFDLGCDYSTLPPESESPTPQATTLIHEREISCFDAPAKDYDPEHGREEVLLSVERDYAGEDEFHGTRIARRRSRGRGRGRGPAKNKVAASSGIDNPARQVDSEVPKGRERNRKHGARAPSEGRPPTSLNLDTFDVVQGQSRTSKKRPPRRRPPAQRR